MVMLRRIKHHIGNFLPALRYPNYRLYFFGQGISLIGTMMQSVAEQWLVYPTLTNNKSLLGIVSAINLLPVTALVLLAGVWADRVDRRRAQMILQSLYAVIAFVMSYLIFSGRVEVWHVMVAALVSGVIFSFDMPTRQSLMVNLVDRQHFASAVSLNGAIFNGARMIGPAVAGALIAAAGIAPAYFFNGISFLAVIVSVYWMRIPKPSTPVHRATIRSQFKEGLDYIRLTPMVYIALTLLAVLTIFTWPLNTLLAVFAHDIYNRGEVGFGLLQSAFGAGAMTGAFGFSALFQKVKRKDLLLIVSVLIVSLPSVVYAFWHQFVGALVLLFLSGWGVTTTIGVFNTTIQTMVPDRLRGRIMSYYSFVLVGGMPFGALLASIGVGVIGAPYTIFFCTVAFLLISFSILSITKHQFLAKLSL